MYPSEVFLSDFFPISSVWVVLYMEGNEQSEHRLLRSVKNRFGSTSEVGVFAMTESGLADVTNPSELFLSPDDQSSGASAVGGTEGACVAVLMEGSR
jgi:DNA repair protein RadA/Sms